MTPVSWKMFFGFNNNQRCSKNSGAFQTCKGCWGNIKRLVGAFSEQKRSQSEWPFLLTLGHFQQHKRTLDNAKPKNFRSPKSRLVRVCWWKKSSGQLKKSSQKRV